MTKQAHFGPDALKFLADLAKHNEREWFEAHRERFERSLRDPFVAFLVDFAPRLARLSERFVIDARPHGGSLARIHRDMRFTDIPYKTALSAHFHHDKAKEGARPSFFLSLEPGRSFVGGGVREPSAAALKKLKKAVGGNEERWAKVTKGLQIERFTAKIPLSDDQVTSARFIEEVVAACKRLAPFVGFVTEAVGARL